MMKNNEAVGEVIYKRKPEVKIWFVVAVCMIAFVCVALVFLISELLVAHGNNVVAQPTYYMMRIFIGLFDVVVGIVFSLILLSHNRAIRDMNRDNSIRGEESWRLNFAASNYSMVDFIDNMLLYEQYKVYTSTLKKTHDFLFYLRQDNIELTDVQASFDNYMYITVKIPFQLMAGKNVAGIQITRFKFSKEGKDFRFVPCAAGVNTLILHNESTGHEELTVNLIAKKGDSFFSADSVVEFNKIKLNLTVISLLGVAVTGWCELYFTNPQKLEKGGANMYKITSSQFKISELPMIVRDAKTEI